jgi:hypothetical protein
MALMVLRWPTIAVLQAIALRASAPDRATRITRASSHKEFRKAEKKAAARPLNHELAALAAEGRIVRAKLRAEGISAAFGRSSPPRKP